MTDYVDKLIAAELPRAVEAIGIRMREITSSAAARHALGNSRIFIEYQTAIIEGLGAYGRTLRERLAQFDAEHSPVSVGDFDKAVASIDELSRGAIELYEKKRENKKPFGGISLPFDESRLTAVVTSAKNELRGFQRELASRRSIYKRLIEPGLLAFGHDLLSKVMWAVFWFLLGALSGPVWNVLSKLSVGR